MNDDARITGVADTALWVAQIRAAETRRPDAAFRDQLAVLLAGARGPKIARSIPQGALVSWGVVMRTAAIDRLLLEALVSGVDTVINLGAGMDTRPYRMELPAGLRWVEVDLPGLIDTKISALQSHTPVCRLERIAADLSNRAARQALFTSLGALSHNALLISEGVIPYLSREDVADMARELFEVPGFRHWIQDFDNAGERRKTPRSWARKFESAPFLFQAADWFEFFRQTGWQTQTRITSAEESERLHRSFPFTFPLGLLMHVLPKSVSHRVQSASGAVLLKKISSGAERRHPRREDVSAA